MVVFTPPPLVHSGLPAEYELSARGVGCGADKQKLLESVPDENLPVWCTPLTRDRRVIGSLIPESMRSAPARRLPVLEAARHDSVAASETRKAL